MVPRIYIDTSVIGGCFDVEFKEWSNKLFEEFQNGIKLAVISDITLDELSFAREEVRTHLNTVPERFKEFTSKDFETEDLADEYVKQKAVSGK